MWVHYCSNHEGFVVGFDVNHSLFNKKVNEDDLFRHLRPVIYSTERPNKYILDAYNDSDGLALMEDIFISKSIDWRYEAEWRMIIFGVTKIIHNKIIGLDTVPIEAIKEIYLGVKSETELKEYATDFCRRNKILAFYQMNLHETNYALIPNLITI